MNTTFTLDGEYVGHMEEVEVTARDKWSYNVSVFSKAGFEDREPNTQASKNKDSQSTYYSTSDGPRWSCVAIVWRGH